MPLETKVALSIEAREIISAGLKAGVIPSKFENLLLMPTGTADGSCDLVCSVSASSVAASSTTSYDLSGTLKDAQGNNVVFAEVVLIALRNKRSTAQATLTIGPHATNGFGTLATGKGFWAAALGSGGGDVVGPCHATRDDLQSWVVKHDVTGVPVTAGTGDILAVIASAVSGDTNAWDLLVIGRSA